MCFPVWLVNCNVSIYIFIKYIVLSHLKYFYSSHLCADSLWIALINQLYKNCLQWLFKSNLFVFSSLNYCLILCCNDVWLKTGWLVRVLGISVVIFWLVFVFVFFSLTTLWVVFIPLWLVPFLSIISKKIPSCILLGIPATVPLYRKGLLRVGIVDVWVSELVLS